MTPDETGTIADTIERARLGLNPQPENTVVRAVDFAIRHHGEQESCFGLPPGNWST
jgi:hypothetical protein